MLTDRWLLNLREEVSFVRNDPSSMGWSPDIKGRGNLDPHRYTDYLPPTLVSDSKHPDRMDFEGTLGSMRERNYQVRDLHTRTSLESLV